MYSNTLFCVPSNDAEAVAIINLLQQYDCEVFVSAQSWGANWKELAQELEVANVNVSNFDRLFAVEFQGEQQLNVDVVNIDHHIYENDDRSNKLSSLEQVANLFDHEMTVKEQFISANDTQFIPGMKQLGLELGLADEKTRALIEEVRAADRNAQGVTIEQESQAVKAIEDLVRVNNTIIINSAHSKCACYTDRLYGTYDRLLVLSEDGESNFYGDKVTIESLFDNFGGWTGGDIDADSGFWGGYAPQDQVRDLVIYK